MFEDQTITKEELWEALAHNFAGKNGEAVRQKLLAAPKYGNDIDYVDELVVKGYDTYLDEIKKYKNTPAMDAAPSAAVYAGTSSVASNVPQGTGTCATPDGRYQGDPLAGAAPPPSAPDTNGRTHRACSSRHKLKTEEIVGGVLLNRKPTPQVLGSDENWAVSLRHANPNLL